MLWLYIVTICSPGVFTGFLTLNFLKQFSHMKHTEGRQDVFYEPWVWYQMFADVFRTLSVGWNIWNTGNNLFFDTYSIICSEHPWPNSYTLNFRLHFTSRSLIGVFWHCRTFAKIWGLLSRLIGVDGVGRGGIYIYVKKKLYMFQI